MVNSVDIKIALRELPKSDSVIWDVRFFHRLPTVYWDHKAAALSNARIVKQSVVKSALFIIIVKEAA